MITKLPGRDGTVRVTFAMPSTTWADTIHVVGDFNGWDEQATPLRQTDSGWMATVELEAGRSYQYRYLLNGEEWHNDWNADRYVPNAFGGDNSVVITPIYEAQEQAGEPTEERVVGYIARRPRLGSTG